MLQYVPRYPTKVTTLGFQEVLNSNEIEVTQRTIQRDLRISMKLFSTEIRSEYATVEEMAMKSNMTFTLWG